MVSCTLEQGRCQAQGEPGQQDGWSGPRRGFPSQPCPLSGAVLRSACPSTTSLLSWNNIQPPSRVPLGQPHLAFYLLCHDSLLGGPWQFPDWPGQRFRAWHSLCLGLLLPHLVQPSQATVSRGAWTVQPLDPAVLALLMSLLPALGLWNVVPGGRVSNPGGLNDDPQDVSIPQSWSL